MPIRYVRQGLRLVRVETSAPQRSATDPAEEGLSGEDFALAAALIRRAARELRAGGRRRLALLYGDEEARTAAAAALAQGRRPNGGSRADPRRDLPGAALRRARRLAGLSQRQLAREFPYGRSLVAECERGVRSVPLDLAAWARYVLRTHGEDEDTPLGVAEAVPLPQEESEDAVAGG